MIRRRLGKLVDASLNRQTLQFRIWLAIKKERRRVKCERASPIKVKTFLHIAFNDESSVVDESRGSPKPSPLTSI